MGSPPAVYPCMVLTIAYSRIRHAAHYAPSGGHDLEMWDVTGELELGKRTGHPIAPSAVPADVEYHSGYMDAHQRQHWLFVRTASLTGACARCDGMAKR